MKKAILILLPILLAACDSGSGTKIEYLDLPGMENPLPISTAVRVGDMLYLSGFIAYDPDTGGIIEGGIQAETRATLEGISFALDHFGSSIERVVKCTVFLADISEWGAMNEVYTTYFANKPARSALGVSGLALGARVEIECIAVIE